MSTPWASNLWEPRAQMQTPTRMDKVAIEDYYHMTTLNEDVNWMETDTSIVKILCKP